MLQLPPVSHLSNLLDTISQNNKIVKSRESAVCKIDGTLPPANDSRFPPARKQINYGPCRSLNVCTLIGASWFNAVPLGSTSERCAEHPRKGADEINILVSVFQLQTLQKTGNCRFAR
jgi:hypothetical protein